MPPFIVTLPVAFTLLDSCIEDVYVMLPIHVPPAQSFVHAIIEVDVVEVEDVDVDVVEVEDVDVVEVDVVEVLVVLV